MPKLPNPTIDAIYQSYVAKRNNEPERDYLGASEIGEECCRRLWYSFRHVSRVEFEGRMLRLFDTGNIEETRIIADLRATGAKVYDRAPDGNQYRFEACDGHFSGGLDGVIEELLESPKTPHLLEAKSHNKKSFDDLEKNGVEKSKPKHIAQMQVLMHLADLTRAAYVAACKDDDRLWMERLEYSPTMGKDLILKANRIIHAETPPDKLGKDITDWRCKFCPFIEHCHGTARPMVNCRTCVHSAPTSDAAWSCSVSGQCPTICERHLIIPDLLPWAEPTDGDTTFVAYKLPDGRRFANVGGTNFDPALLESGMMLLASSEVVAIPIEAIGNDQVEMARATLGGKICSKE